MKRSFFILLSLAVLSLSAQDNIQWRGTDRTGIYRETGLMKSWPANGPEMLWHYGGLGEGHSSVAIASGKIYVTGLSDGKGHLFVFNSKGKLLNKIMYGDEWTVNYVGTRGTPTIDNGKIYLVSGIGDLICWDENKLDVLWKRNIFNDFGSTNIAWGVNESPLIIGEKIIVTPGGKEHNIVALNKHTGELIWSSPGKGDLSAYCSPLYIEDQRTPLIVTITARNIVGLEASTGKVLWSHESVNKNSIHANTPIYSDNMVLCSSVDKGSTMLRLTDGGRKAEIVWELPELDNMMGALIKTGGYFYGSGSGYKNKLWYCVDWKTGEIKWKEKVLSAGNIITADGMLYCYTDKGEMALVKPTPEKFDIVSQFQITMGTEQHWAHPVIHKGMMYVRHGNTLMAYAIK
ncbi:MAG: PQQ-binding-like beta-propeller repeat protein [Bacteroidales bacterium]|jgi:outer membrane protein assembly factor BamB|nr:PQQ-binding-like beta-propeller repeat protein [Bacteroidales bacterium]